MRRGVCGLLVASLSLAGLGVGPAVAQPSSDPGWPPPEGAACKVTKGQTDEAKTLFQLGTNAFDKANYTDAIKYWQDAYKRDCTAHLLLKNLGRAYEADGQYAAAVDAYKLYRARAKLTGDDLDIIDAKIANLSKKVPPVATATATATATAAPTETATAMPTVAPTATATAAPTTTATTAPTTAPTTSPTTSPTGSPPEATSDGPGAVPWVFIIGGVVIGGGGAVLWATSNSTVSSKSKSFDALNCGTGPLATNVNQCNSLASDGKSAKTTRTLGAIGTFVGVAALGVGVGWELLAPRKGSSSTASLHLSPGIAPGFAGLSLNGAF